MARKVHSAIEDRRLRLRARDVAACIEQLDRFSGFCVPAGSLNVAWVTPGKCRRLHAAFFNDPSLTDVMTFPGDPEDDHAGDVAICPSVAVGSAAQIGISFAEELTLYLVHAWLHLAGLDDRTPAQRKQMRHAESGLLAHLRSQSAILVANYALQKPS